jgi:membrane protease YdiL (CAAX protease family)
MSDDTFIWQNTKQLSIVQIILTFLIPSAIAFTGFRIVLPKLVEGGIPSIIAWPAVASIGLFGLVLVAIVFLNKEAKKLNVSFKERACLRSLSLKQWSVYVGILIFGMVVALVLTKVSILFTQLPGLSVPDYFPFFLNPAIDPMNTESSLLTPGFVLKGAFWLIPFIALTLFLNILAEDLYFRAWLLPKLSKYGKLSWVINGGLFAFYHTFQLWLLPQILPISLFLAYVVYKSKSIWPALAFHLFFNTLTVVGMVFLIMS